MTYNVDESVGYFSILDTNDLVDDEPLGAKHTQSNDTSPFSPIGVAHKPAEGYYDGGEGNTNDLFVWAFDTKGTATSAGDGQMFAYQMPTSPDLDGTFSMEYFLLGNTNTFQASLAPEFTNFGRSMYWAVSRR